MSILLTERAAGEVKTIIEQTAIYALWRKPGKHRQREWLHAAFIHESLKVIEAPQRGFNEGNLHVVYPFPAGLKAKSLTIATAQLHIRRATE